jgi:hypothetical protein
MEEYSQGTFKTVLLLALTVDVFEVMIPDPDPTL